MTEIPEHLLKRAKEAREKAASQDTSGYTPEQIAMVERGLPAHLIERVSRTRNRAETPQTLPSLSVFQEKLNLAIEERKALFSEQPVSQLVLESCESGLVIGAAMKRYPGEFRDEMLQRAWDYKGTLSSQTTEQMDRFRHTKLGDQFTNHGESIEAGMVAILRPWTLLADRGATSEIPKRLDTALFGQILSKTGVFKTLKVAVDQGSLVRTIIDKSGEFAVYPAFADAIDSFDGLLSAPKDSPEWDINHWEKDSPNSFMRDQVVYNPAAFTAGARLVASLIE